MCDRGPAQAQLATVAIPYPELLDFIIEREAIRVQKEASKRPAFYLRPNPAGRVVL